MQYLAGYVIRKLILAAKKKNNEDEISILHNAITDDHNQKLIHSTNRGGLTSVKHEWVQILVLAEEMFRVETLSSARKIDVEKIKNTIQVHPKAISLFNSLVHKNVDENLKQKDLINMVSLYIRVRAFSHVKDVVNMHKKEKQIAFKEKALRKKLASDNSI